MMIDRIQKVAILMLVSLATISLAVADTSWITEQHIIEAILEQTTFTAQELEELDLTGDGQHDVADLICFKNRCHLQAEFVQTTTQVSEGVGLVQVDVTFSEPVTGTLAYTVGGTATLGADFTDVNAGSIPVNSDSVQLQFLIADDATFDEETEYIFITLEDGAAYSLGSTIEHRIQVLENDARWAGTIESGGASLGFELRILSEGGSHAAALVSSGVDFLPGGAYLAQNLVLIPGDTFHADFQNIVMPAGLSLTNVPIIRSFEFNPDDLATVPPTPTPVEPSYMAGLYRETRDNPQHPHLFREIVGRFYLRKLNPKPSSFEAELAP